MAYYREGYNSIYGRNDKVDVRRGAVNINRVRTPVTSNGLLTSRVLAAPYQISAPSRKKENNRRRGSQEDAGTPSILVPSESDLVVFNNPTVSAPEYIVARLMEDIGGQEIINVARSLTINGQNVVYQPIKNSAYIQAKYGSSNLVPVQGTSYEFFENFSIRFVDYIPEVGTGPNGEYVYLDEDGNVVINVVNIKSDEQVEVQIVSDATVLDDTIYVEENS